MDLRTTYLGLELEHPLVASASPLTEKLDGFLRLEDGGAAAIVMHSLFEEQVLEEEAALDHYLHYGHESYAEALSYFPRAHEYRLTPERHLDLLSRAKERVSVPIIASLNGVSRGGWVEYARLLEEAGADALELNLYYIPTDPALSGAEVEAMYLDTIQAVVESVKIPVAVKVGPRLHRLRPLRQAGGGDGGQGPRHVQPLLSAGLRSGDPLRGPDPHPLPALREPPQDPLDRPPLRAGWAWRWPSPAGSTPARRR
jgi:dihydroorotate dehydrogenase (fumarate)